mgnify:CR=1 FL=1
MYPDKTFGVIGGRFQGWHKGHQDNIDAIRECGLTPIIFVSTGVKEGDCYSFDQIATMIQLVNPELSTKGTPPNIIHYPNPARNFEEWVDETAGLYDEHGLTPDNTMLFSVINYDTYKDDIFDATYKGRTIKDTYYSEAFAKFKGYDTHVIDKRERERSGRLAREDFATHRDMFHPSVEQYIVSEFAKAVLNNRPVGADQSNDVPFTDGTVRLEALEHSGISLGEYQIKLLKEGKADSFDRFTPPTRS